MPTIRDRRARAATTAIFFMTGALYAAWATRIPAIQDRLHLSPGQLGLAILGLEGGAILGLPAGGALAARIGTRASLRIGFVAYPAALVAVAVAPSLVALAAALGAMAAATSIVDVAANAQGIEVERRYGRPVLSGLHAGHSFGLVVGGLAGVAAASAGVPVAAHFAPAAAAGLVVVLASTSALVREEAGADRRVLVRPSGRLALLGAIAFCTFLLDGGAYNWSAVALRTQQDAAPGLAAAAFTVFSLFLAIGRLGGDRLIARAGRARVVRGGGALASCGSLLAIAAPSAPASLAGWAVFGLGISVIAPTVLGAAPGASEAPAPVAIAAVTTVGYLGSFTGPPLIGALAGPLGLAVALGLLVAVSAVVALLAGPGLSRSPSAALARRMKTA